MAYKETFWMACDSTEQMRAEYGPFHTRAEAEQEARKLAFGYLLRYEHIIGDNEDIQEVRCIFVELPAGPIAVPARLVRKLHTRCASCGETAIHVALIGADTFSCSWSKQKVALNYRETGAGAGRVVSIEVQ